MSVKIITTLNNPGPRKVTIAIAIINSGNALIPSMRELTVLTTNLFFEIPKRIPTTVPITSGIVTPRKAIPISAGTAAKTRVITSLPS